MDFRQYDPSTGRFYNIDLLAEATYSVTPYHFAGNNPVIGSDPTGLLTFFNGIDHSRPKMPQGGQNGYGMINWFGNTEDSFLDNVHNGYGLDPLGGGGFPGSTPYGLGTGYSGGYQGHLDYAEGGHWLYVGKRNIVVEVTGNNAGYGNDAIIGIDAIPYYIWQPLSLGRGDANSKDFSNLLSNINTDVGFASVAYGLLENSIANKYWWMDAKGKYNSAKILAKGANGKYLNPYRGIAGTQMGYNKALQIASKAKVAGNILGGVGIALTGVAYLNGDISGLEATVDSLMGAAAFFGPIGFGISATYFLSKTAFEYFSGETVFEKPNKQ